jgi:hypothetical protein
MELTAAAASLPVQPSAAALNLAGPRQESPEAWDLNRSAIDLSELGGTSRPSLPPRVVHLGEVLARHGGKQSWDIDQIYYHSRPMCTMRN